MKFIEYIKDTKSEMRHVNWPTRKQAIGFTAIVIGLSVITALFLGFFDFIFSLGLEKIILN
jgi:preprotein translocase subunit SecE